MAQAIRTITFTATADGVTPAGPQFAGVQGEHNAAEVVFQLDDQLGKAAYIYRVEFVDGAGGFDTSETLTMNASRQVVCPLPSSWTAAGGNGTIRLCAAQVTDGSEEQIVYTLAGRLVFAPRQSGTPMEQAYQKGLTALIEETGEAADEARQAAQQASAVAGEVLDQLEAGAFKGEKGDPGPVGPQGPQGEPGADGTGVTILDAYATEEELRAAHPTGQPADAYLVDGDLYVWSAQENDWLNAGTIQGPAGPAGPQGPNQLTADTSTSYTGLLKGAAGKVTVAAAGTDYIAGNDYGFPLAAGTTTGTASAFVLTLNPPLTAYVPGMMLSVNFHTTPQTPTVTLNINGLGAKPLAAVGITAQFPLAAGRHTIQYDGAYWRVLDVSYLPIMGGTMRGNIVPEGTGMHSVGTDNAPFNTVRANTGKFQNVLAAGVGMGQIGGPGVPFGSVYATNGAFTNLMVSSQNVWHAGNLQIAIGTVSITPSAATTPASQVVSFGKTFSAPPNVILTATNSGNAHVFSWSTSNITTTQFTAYVSNSAGAYPSYANWVAIGI